MVRIIEKLKLLHITSSNPRTLNHFNQVKGSFVFKSFAVLISFLIVPLMVNYLGIEKYGIWSTMLSLVSWTLFFDFGLANGTRNKVAEAFANNDSYLARIYISTSYISITVISITLFSGISIASIWIDWQNIFNTVILTSKELRFIVLIVLFCVLINFILSIINQIFHSIQKTSFVVFGQFFTNLLSFIFIYLLSQFSCGKMNYLAVFYGFPIILSSLTLNIAYFKKNLNLIPGIKFFYISKVKDLLGLGAKFFIIQLAVLVIFTSDKIIITQILGPEHVTPYDITVKLFYFIIILHSLINEPLWSAYTDAYIKNDLKWIRKTCIKMTLFLFPISIIILIFVFTSEFIIRLWVGPQIIISDFLKYCIGLFTIVSIWNNTWGIILSGIGKIRLGAYCSIVTGVINIPLSIYFADKFGTSGVILGTICSISISAILSPIQVWCFIFSKKQLPTLEKILC